MLVLLFLYSSGDHIKGCGRGCKFLQMLLVLSLQDRQPLNPAQGLASVDINL